jgi:hypothetical protein
MSEEQKELTNLPATVQQDAMVLANMQNKAGFELLQRMAKLFASSDLVPKEFKGNVANCVIGLEMAQRMNASPLAVLQNLYIVHGKPSWSAQFIIAAINSTGKFSPLRFQVVGEKDQKEVTAWAIEKDTGERLEGPPVSIEMSKKEGWYSKNGSKWQTLPDLMLRYRAATFFGRLYAPEVLMGMQTSDEIYDVYDVDTDIQSKTESAKEALKEKLAEKRTRKPKQDPSPETEKPVIVDEPEDMIACAKNGGDMMKVNFCKEKCDQSMGCPELREYFES